MNGSGRAVVIAGAGIAGLTLSLALAKLGAHVVVLERNPAVQDFGAGLQISPNARRVLNHLGLDDALRTKSFEPEAIDAYGFGAVRPLAAMALGETVRARFGLPYAVMHRADLAQILHKAARRFASIDIQFSVSGFSVQNDDAGVLVEFTDNLGQTQRRRAFAFVGADGIRSPTRSLIGGPAPAWANATAWRALADLDEAQGLFHLARTSLLFGPGFHAVVYPLPHRQAFNIALFAPGSAEGAAPALPASIRKSPHFSALFAMAENRWGAWPLGTVENTPWFKSSVGLIGDAAHAMLPFQAQGAAMAIEDAATLAPLLMSEAAAQTSFIRFAAIRQPRVERVARLSAANGSVFHMRWPLSATRNFGVRLQGRTGHLRRLDWLYGHDALNPP